MPSLSFGFKTAPQHTSYEAMLDLWTEADLLENFEHAWLFDHFAPIHGDINGPCFEGWTLLAALAAQTSRVRVGIMVTGNTYRNPAVLANMAATVDIIANGRLDFGIGAGWNQYEHESMDIPLYAPGERIRRLGEACAIIKSLLTQPLTTFEGRYYQIREARCEPKPIQKPTPPFVIGGSGEQLTLRIVAEHADIWNFAGGTPDQFRHKVEVLRSHCQSVGRDPAAIRLSVQPPVNYEDIDATRKLVQDFVDAGADHVILNLRAPYPPGILARLDEDVIQQVSG